MPSNHLKNPEHIAIIMDGNGRWAEDHNTARRNGHYEGAKNVEKIINACRERQVRFLTLYTFSTENWKRSQSEVNNLMKILDEFLSKFESKLKKQKISFKAIGQIERFPIKIQNKIAKITESTKEFNDFTVVLALSYGGREEITSACRKIISQIQSGTITTEEITEKLLAQNLYTANIPDPDLIIRTAGEFRLSNFLLWQAAYSEFWSTPTLWPDFSAEKLQEAIDFFNTRKRKFGGR